jgi:hypothetical protein
MKTGKPDIRPESVRNGEYGRKSDGLTTPGSQEQTIETVLPEELRSSAAKRERSMTGTVDSISRCTSHVAPSTRREARHVRTRLLDVFTITLPVFLLIAAIWMARRLGLGKLRDWLSGEG